MHIGCVSNNGKPYLQVMESYSVVEDGVRKSKKRTIFNLGPLSRFDDGKPDFLKRLRQSFKDGTPIIEELNHLVKGTPTPRKVRIEFDTEDESHTFSEPKNIGYFVLDAMYDALGIYDVLNKYKSTSRISYDLNGCAKLLVFGRTLAPESKSATWRARGGYLFDVVKSSVEKEVYRALDVLDEASEKIQTRMDYKIGKHIGRNKNICFYDVTNYWFSIDDSDEDVFSESGDIVSEGMRKSGPSKKKTREPIVQMGLFMDDNGIPVSYKIFPGNHIDQTTLRPAMKDTLSKMGYSRTIIVADGGLNSGKNLAYIVSQGNGYIVSKSAKGSPKKTKEWILAGDGYVWNENRTFKVKSEIRARSIVDENGNEIEIKEKIISYWSKKQYDYASHENKKFQEYLDSAREHPDKLKDRQPKYKKYLRKEESDAETGEIIKTVTILSLNEKKIKEDTELMGYYTVLTSEVGMDDREVIDKYHGLSRIEDSFRIIKSDLYGRPVHVWRPEHINAHFLTCFIALTMIRILQCLVLKHEGKNVNNARKWEMGIPAYRIKKALAEFNADAIPDGYFRLTKVDGDLARIASAIGVDIALKLPTEKEIREMKYQLDKALFM